MTFSIKDKTGKGTPDVKARSGSLHSGACQMVTLFTVHPPILNSVVECCTGGADKSLARLGRKQAIVTEDFDVHISHL